MPTKPDRKTNGRPAPLTSGKGTNGPDQEITPGEGSIKLWFREFLDLRDGMDRQDAVVTITSGNLMRGSNAWMLVCSIMIASLGLNLNSGAVIIGAMLISPLMNPILGVGLGVGTNDRALLWAALKNFGVAILIALVTSFVYFFFTPLELFTDEMRARTEPTILDGLVAVFGGLAGIISVTRSDKTNAIPGVAIATALMPPLCVAGYGLVLGVRGGGDFTVFLRAFYLFFLNSFFIAVTAYLIIRILRFPYRKYLNRNEARRSQIIIGVVSLLMILPGVFILQEVLREQRDERAALEFTERYFPASLSTYLLDRTNPNRPKLIYPVMAKPLGPDSLAHYGELLRQDPYHVDGATIVVDTSFSPSEIASMKGELASLDDINNRLRSLETAQGLEARQRQHLQARLDLFHRDSAQFLKFTEQLLLAFPDLRGVRLARAQSGGSAGTDGTATRYFPELPLVVLQDRPGARRPAAEQQRLEDYLRTALELDTLVVIREGF